MFGILVFATAAGRLPAQRRNKVSEQLTIKTSGQLSNELAAVNLVSKLMAITLDELKRASKPWSQRSATDQDDTIGRIADGVRAAEWMAWLCDKPATDDPARKVIARGQGCTPEEACRSALESMAVPNG